MKDCRFRGRRAKAERDLRGARTGGKGEEPRMGRRDVWMGAVADGGESGDGLRSQGSRSPGQGLIEVEVRDGFGLGGIECGRLIEEPREEIALGRSASGGKGRGFVGEALTPRNVRCAGAPGRGGAGWRRRRADRSETRGSSSRRTTLRAVPGGTHERQHVIDAREQDGPADSGRGGGLVGHAG